MKKLPKIARRRVGGSGEDLVRVRPLLEGRAHPTVIEPKVDGLDLVSWASNNRERIASLLTRNHALLFRGFEADGSNRQSLIDRFERFVETASTGERLFYKDRSTPRNSYGDRIYNATVYPPDQTIRLHNEGTYWVTWARKIFFACVTNAETGGETPIGDVHAVYERIDPEVRKEFEAKGVLYVRNYNDGFGLTWQNVYQTEDPNEVEAYCNANDIQFEWKDGGRLRTRQLRPAVRVHPDGGEKLWFNHAAFFHVSSLDPTTRDAFLSELGEDGLPYNTYYGDGSSIDPDTIAHIHSAYEAEKVVFRWQTGDVALYDNMRIAHARQPFTGERLTLVAMTEPYRGPETVGDGPDIR
ncbi:MAG TPA: TauD/TfdA family dioxygenase [Planctomycetes bacterium]|nr:TauD/TfdA family dioxygenase [Planctomycetota bacterium]